MALLAWFPLNGNLHNQGLIDLALQSVTTPSFVVGKVTTQAMSTGAATISANQTANLFNPYEMSFCFWIKPSGTDGSGIIFGNNSMTHPNNRKFSIFQWNNKTRIHLSWQSDTSDSADIVGWTSDDNFLKLDEWAHIAIIYHYKWNHVKIYKNGILAAKPSLNKPYPINTNFANATSLFNNSTLRYLNDFRIYNHALSQTEVKELAKGLVCHYSFDTCVNKNLLIEAIPTVQNGSSSNLAIAEYTYQGIKGYRLTKSINEGWGSYLRWPVNPSLLDKNKKYSFSVMAVSLNDDETVNIHQYFDNAGSSNAFLAANYKSVTKKLQTFKWENCTPRSAFNPSGNVDFYGWHYFINRTGVDIFIAQPKLEACEACTGISKYAVSSDTSDNDHPSIPDDSGYNIRGTSSGDIKFSINTIRGDKCAVFNGSNAFIACGRDAMVTDEITVSVWGYMDDWTQYYNSNNKGRLISCTETGGWNIEGVSSPSKINFALYSNGAYRYSYSDNSKISNLTPGWHLFTGTWNGFSSKLYIDGCKTGESTSLSTKSPITYNSSNGIFIGAEAAGNQTTPSTSEGYFPGKIADVKIYGTALSDEDIAEEYKNILEVDKNRTIFTKNVQEDITRQNLELTNSGSLKTIGIFETMTLSDGSKWVPISVHYAKDGVCDFIDAKSYYKSPRIWNNFGLINSVKRPEEDYEFYVLNQLADNSFRWYRFKQSINPFQAKWADVNPSKVGTIVTRIDCSPGVTNNYAGMYWQNSAAAMCFANTSSDNWFGCGVIQYWHSGNTDIPSYNSEAVLGWQVVYMRVAENNISFVKKGLLKTTLEEN